MQHFKALIILMQFAGLTANCQSRIQFLLSGGSSITPVINYQHSTGHISSSATGSFAILYNPLPSLGIEVKFQVLNNPTTYLNNDSSSAVRAYSSSPIVMQRALAGLNYYVPLKTVKPFVGMLIGAAYAQTTEIYPETSMTSFTWGFQAGATVLVYKFISLRLDGCKIFIPHVYNNSAYFNTAADGSGFPSFAIGQPSRANIRQWNINLGLVLSVLRKKKQAL